MTCAELGGELRLAADDLGILRAQRRDGARLDRFGDRSRLGAAAAEPLDLVVAGLRFRGAAARLHQLIADLAQLLLVDELPARADDVVLRLELLDALLGFAHALLELGQPPGERSGGAAVGLPTRPGPVFRLGPGGIAGGLAAAVAAPALLAHLV